MFYRTDLLIYIWMLPLVGLIVLPSLFVMIGIFYRGVERFRFADLRGFIDVGTEPVETDRGERRRQPRVHIEGPKAIVVEQVRCCQSNVSNITAKGMCFSSIPRKMFAGASDKFKVIFRSRDKDFNLIVKTKWKKLEKNGYTIGTEILSGSSGWDDFVKGFC